MDVQESVIKSFGQIFFNQKKKLVIYDEDGESEKKIDVYDIPTGYFINFEKEPAIYGKFEETGLMDTVKKIKYDNFKHSKITPNIVDKFRNYFYRHPDFKKFLSKYLDNVDLNIGQYFSEFMKLAVKFSIYSDNDIRQITNLRFYFGSQEVINLIDDSIISQLNLDNQKLSQEDEGESAQELEEQASNNQKLSEDDAVITKSYQEFSTKNPQVFHKFSTGKGGISKDMFLKLWNSLKMNRFLTPLGDEEDEKWLKEKAKEAIDFLGFKIKEDEKYNILRYRNYLDRDNVPDEFVDRIEKLVLFNYQLDKKVRSVIKKYRLDVVKEASDYKPRGRQKFFLVMQGRENIIASSRRSGKSFSSIYLGLRQLFLPGQMIVYIIPTKEGFSEQPFFYAKKFIDNISAKGWKLEGMSTNSKDFKLYNQEIGSKLLLVSAQGSNQGARSYTANLVIMDEAAYVSNDNIYDVAYATTATTKGVIVAVSTINIDTPINWFYYKKIDLENAEDGLSMTIDLYNNPFITDYEKRRIEKQYKDKNPLVRNCEWMAIFNTDKSQFEIDKFFIINFDYTVLSLRGLNIKIANNLKQYNRFVIGFDPARDQDKSGLVIVGVKDGKADVVATTYLEYNDYFKQMEVISQIYSYLENLGKKVEIALDLGKGGQVIFDYYRSKGFQVYGVYSTAGRETTKKSYREYNVPKKDLESLLAAVISENKLKGFTFLEGIRDEFETYQEAEERKADHHHDILSALMVALYVMYERHIISFYDKKKAEQMQVDKMQKSIEEMLRESQRIQNNNLTNQRMQRFLY